MIEKKVPAGCGRLVSYLRKQYPNLQYSTIQKALRKKEIRVNGIRLAEDIPLLEGDVIQLYIPDDMVFGMKRPDIAYEDENLIIINKRPGIETAGAGETLEKQVSQWLSAPVYACHRLDAQTGGLVIFAKTKAAYNEMHKAMSERRIRKFYNCIVKGVPKQREAELNAYLVKDSRRSTVRIFTKPGGGAVPIITRYKVEHDFEDSSMLEVELVTGRTHQIRAHMAFIGHPILGDDKYGDRDWNNKRKVRTQQLWAIRLEFNLPNNSKLAYLNGKVITVQPGFSH